MLSLADNYRDAHPGKNSRSFVGRENPTNSYARDKNWTEQARQSENMLLTMLVDEKKELRELAARRIKAARNSMSTCTSADIRKFTVPALNFDADEYYNLLNWHDLPRR
ncbi:hypothetical protein Btru_064084 [Bulinus truncatus]|nr:hypothetical protein Btru_064084 [Bulinus truncatus]